MHKCHFLHNCFWKLLYKFRFRTVCGIHQSKHMLWMQYCKSITLGQVRLILKQKASSPFLVCFFCPVPPSLPLTSLMRKRSHAVSRTPVLQLAHLTYSIIQLIYITWTFYHFTQQCTDTLTNITKSTITTYLKSSFKLLFLFRLLHFSFFSILGLLCLRFNLFSQTLLNIFFQFPQCWWFERFKVYFYFIWVRIPQTRFPGLDDVDHSS